VSGTRKCDDMAVPDRRTLVVIGTLILGMTVTSGLLLLLEPGPVAATPAPLMSTDAPRGFTAEDVLFNVERVRPWKAIVIHDSGSATGSVAELHERAQAHDRAGHGYHFVIGNGSDGGRDGEWDRGPRWRDQLAGDYVDNTKPHGPWFNKNAIGVCLIGNADEAAFTQGQQRELVWLVRQLQSRFKIPAEHVFVAVGNPPDTGAVHFTQDRFRQELIPSFN